MTSLVTAMKGIEGHLVCDPLRMVTLIWMSQESQTVGLPQRTSNCTGDPWNAPMDVIPHAALVTALSSLLGSTAFPRNPHLPQVLVGKTGGPDLSHGIRADWLCKPQPSSSAVPMGGVNAGHGITLAGARPDPSQERGHQEITSSVPLPGAGLPFLCTPRIQRCSEGLAVPQGSDPPSQPAQRGHGQRGASVLGCSGLPGSRGRKHKNRLGCACQGWSCSGWGLPRL